MAVIHSGSCVGVLYWDKNVGEWKVHNGRLAFPHQIEGEHPPHNVWIAHWTINKKDPHAVPHKEIRPLTGVHKVRITHDLPLGHPRRCQAFRGRPNTLMRIYPGTCFGVFFADAKGRDVKNGRFLYWVKRHQPGTHYCVIDRGRIGEISEVYYAHYNIPKGYKNPHHPPKLIPELVRRGLINKEVVIDAYRTSLNPQEKRI